MLKPLLILLLAAFFVTTAKSAEPEDLFPYRMRMGVNHAGVSPWASGVYFANAMKMARPFYTTGDTPQPFRNLDAHLYPKSVPEGGLQALVLNAYFPSGEYVLAWEGDAELTLEPSDSQAGRVELVSAKPNRMVYRVDPKGYFHVKLHSMDSEQPLRNLRLWLPGLEDAGPWNPAYLEACAPFGVYRFMNFMATNRSEVAAWSDRPTPDQLTYFVPSPLRDQHVPRGVPLEWLIELCNVMKADPWFTLPHQATDIHVRSFAEMVNGRLDPVRTVYVEYSNEIFNPAFSQRDYAIRKARERGLDEGEADVSDGDLVARFYGLRATEIFQAFRDVYGVNSDAVVGVVTMGFRHERHLHEAEALLSYRDHHKHFDAMAYAPYCGVGIGNRFDLPFSEMDEEDLMAQLIREQAIQIRAELERAKAVSDKYLLPLLAYEGGQHLSLFGGAIPDKHRERFRDLVVAANRHPLMENFYWHHLRDWYATTDGVYCHFVLVAPPTPGYYWGLKEYPGQPLDEAPKARPFWELSRNGRFFK
ncbi:MAG: hypothetical protein ACFB21_12080 [Opitutales bacterium]